MRTNLERRVAALEQVALADDPVARAVHALSDEELERQLREILSQHPPDRDDELSDRPGSGGNSGMSERALYQHVRETLARRAPSQ